MFYNPTIEEKFAKDIASVLTNGNLEAISSYKDLRKSNSINKIDLKETVHICVASNKGGVGKTLTSFQLAWFLNVLGYKVLLADLDAQANITCSILEDQDSSADAERNFTFIFNGQQKTEQRNFSITYCRATKQVKIVYTTNYRYTHF